MNKQELLDRVNEMLTFAFKQIPLSENQLDRMDFASTLSYIRQAQEDVIKLEAMK